MSISNWELFTTTHCICIAIMEKIDQNTNQIASGKF